MVTALLRSSATPATPHSEPELLLAITRRWAAHVAVWHQPSCGPQATLPVEPVKAGWEMNGAKGKAVA